MDTKKIKQQADIVTIINRYVQLEKKGNLYLGICPFHDDHHPSLTVNPVKQNYICYPCGAKGDVIEFIKEIEKCSFGEAIQKLGKQPPPPPKGGTVKAPVQSKTVAPMKEQTIPFPTIPNPIPPFRGLGGEVLLAHSYLPHPWKAMQGRIIFPIKNENGLLVGYAARTTASSDSPPLGGRGVSRGVGPKYLNSVGLPRTRLLYGLHLAKATIQETGEVYLVEGFKDTLAMHAAEMTNTVGIMGTQLTPEQADLIRKYAQQVIIVMDGDRPGQEAAQKIKATLTTLGLETVTVNLPDGTDPDSLYHEQGKEALINHIRRYTSASYEAEAQLTTAITLYPETVTSFHHLLYAWPLLIEQILETDDLVFETDLHRQLLAHYATNGNTPPPLEKQAEAARRLQQEYAAAITTLTATTPISTLFYNLLHLYCEKRLVTLIKTQTKKLSTTTNTGERTHLLQSLTHRREQLKTLSENMSTSGAVK